MLLDDWYLFISVSVAGFRLLLQSCGFLSRVNHRKSFLCFLRRCNHICVLIKCFCELEGLRCCTWSYFQHCMNLNLWCTTWTIQIQKSNLSSSCFKSDFIHLDFSHFKISESRLSSDWGAQEAFLLWVSDKGQSTLQTSVLFNWLITNCVDLTQLLSQRHWVRHCRAAWTGAHPLLSLTWSYL